MIAELETISELTIGSKAVSEEGIRSISNMRNLDRLTVDIKKSILLSKEALVALLGEPFRWQRVEWNDCGFGLAQHEGANEQAKLDAR